jgi:hypothetical protein
LAIEAPGRPQDAIDGRGADGGDIVVEHHERQPPVALERVSVEVVDDCLALPQLDPVVARDLAITSSLRQAGLEPLVLRDQLFLPLGYGSPTSQTSETGTLSKW